MATMAWSKFRYLNQRLTTRAGLRDWVYSALAFGVPLLAYVRTLAPTVYGLDSAELTTGAFSLGIVHAPGSPTFLLLGRVFAYLPFGDVGYRLNLMSAVSAALAVLFTYHILVHLTRERFVSLASAWLFALTYYTWISAVAAELYAPAACFAAALIWLAQKWRQDARSWQLYLLALLFGLGLGVHLALALLGPGLAWLVLTAPSKPWRSPRQIAIAIACGFLGALVYVYIPLGYVANPSLNYARGYWGINLASWDGFWWMVTGRMFSTLFFAIPPVVLPAEFSTWFYRLWSNFMGLGLVMGLIGLVAGFRRQWMVQTGLALMFLAYLVFYIPYGASDKETMFLPAFLIWAIWAGWGFHFLKELLHARFQDAHDSLVPALILLVAASAFMLNLPLTDLSTDWRARRWGESILASIEPNAFYFGTWADVPILEYLQVVEGKQRGVTTINMFFTGPVRGKEMAREQLEQGIPVYTSARAFTNDENFELERVDACFCYRAVLLASSRRDK